MKLTKIVTLSADGGGGLGGCASGSCPTIYKSENGKFFIQGFKLETTDKNHFELPSNEDVVEIPEALLTAFIQQHDK